MVVIVPTLISNFRFPSYIAWKNILCYARREKRKSVNLGYAYSLYMFIYLLSVDVYILWHCLNELTRLPIMDLINVFDLFFYPKNLNETWLPSGKSQHFIPPRKMWQNQMLNYYIVHTHPVSYNFDTNSGIHPVPVFDIYKMLVKYYQIVVIKGFFNVIIG